jgi:hypothetical protein
MAFLLALKNSRLLCSNFLNSSALGQLLCVVKELSFPLQLFWRSAELWVVKILDSSSWFYPCQLDGGLRPRWTSSIPSITLQPDF